MKAKTMRVIQVLEQTDGLLMVQFTDYRAPRAQRYEFHHNLDTDEALALIEAELRQSEVPQGKAGL